MADAFDEAIYTESAGSIAAVTKELSVLAEQLKKTKKEWEDFEAKAAEAKKKYETMVRVTVPELFKMNGVTELTTEDGVKCVIKTKFTCSPNKNAEDMAKISAWMKEHDGEKLIKTSGLVSKEAIPMLIAQGVDVAEVSEINTNSLKAWLTAKLGFKDQIASITEADIPDSIHFFKWEEADIK
jgi:predicted nuclease with TOPRIM domain